MLTKPLTKKILASTYIFAVLVSILLCDVKFRSLGFQDRDYAFYMEFATKLLDKNGAETYSLNPEGTNWLFMGGVEGKDSLHQSIHFEPIKYMYAVLYKIFQSPYAIFVFIALIFFIPLLYLALVAPMKSVRDMQYALSLGILYLLSPSVFFVPSFDLRPYLFLAPFFFLAILSIRLARTSWEKLLWFNAMFLAREEALILGALVLLYGIANTYSGNVKISELVTLFMFYGIWAAGTFFYLRWTGYSISTNKFPPLIQNIYNKLISPSPLFILAILAGSIAGFVVAWLMWRRLKENRYFWNVFEFITIAILIIPLGYQLLSDNEQVDLGVYLFSSRYYLHFITVILLLILLTGYFKVNFHKGIWLGFMTIGLGVIILVNTLATDGLLNAYGRFSHLAEQTQPIWSLKENLDPHASSFLVDYSTYQAFFNFEHVYAYNRLPASLVNGKRRYYPKNLPFLQSLISEEIDYVVISRPSLNDINSLMTETSIKGQVIFENEQFIGMEIIR